MNPTEFVYVSHVLTAEQIIMLIIVIFLTLNAFVLMSSLFVIPYVLYVAHLKRTDKTKWGRECSSSEPLQIEMHTSAMNWREENIKYLHEMHIVNEGLNLYGEYLDFGFKKAAIIVPGRTEGLCYGYYFAKPYKEMGYNILTIDQRAHGLSDGEYNTVGFNEHRDLIAWIKMLHDEYEIESIVLHGICIGSSCCMFALTSENCPDYVEGMVAEGMYPTFGDSFKNHMINCGGPASALPLIDTVMKLHTGYSMMYGPIHVIGGLKKPLLMLHSKEDIYSLPETAQVLYDTCGAEQKNLVWFEKGAHSRLRITDTNKYDSSIRSFLSALQPATV